MTMFARSLQVSVLAAAVLTLSACGGDDGSPFAKPIKPTPTPTPAPAPMQAFVAGPQPAYILFGVGITSTGNAATSKQDAAGAVRTLGSTVASAETRVIDITSTAQFALGQWQGGTYRSGDTQRDIKNGLSYVVYNKIAAIGANATLACAPKVTTPWAGGASGSLTGSGKLNINGGVANAEVHLVLTGTDKANVNIDATGVLTVDMPTHWGQLLSGGGQNTAAITLAQGVAGGYTLLAPWQASGSNGTRYAGIAVFACK